MGTGASGPAHHAGHGTGSLGESGRANPVVATLEVQATEFAFDREVLRMTKGQPARLVLRNTGLTEHDFVILGLDATVTKPGIHGQGLHVHTPPGQIDAVEFIPLRSGIYQAICSVPRHKDAGMKLSIRVVD